MPGETAEGESAVINDLDKTLDALLKRDLPSGTVSFDPPDGKFAPSLPCTDLFLYDVRENRDLRVNERVVERVTAGKVTTRRPPVRIDCSYLITAWASDAQNEHLLLSRVIKILLRYPALPEEVLQGSPVKVGRILHPSPASPAANRNWKNLATRQLQALGVWD